MSIMAEGHGTFRDEESSIESQTLPRVPVIQVQSDEPVLPPGYDEVVSSTRYPILRADSALDPDQNTDGSPPPWKLKFVDFTPHLAGVNNTRRNLWSFEKLIDRANTWLQSNRTVDVITCETITWCAEDLRHLNDTDVVTCTLKRSNTKKIHFMRGLRIWVAPRDSPSEDCTTLGVREYLPDLADSKGLENFDLQALIRIANSKIWESPLNGHVISVETVMQPTRADFSKEKLSLKLKDTYWADGVKTDRKYVPILRVIYALGERNLNIEIGITDMVPRVLRQGGRNRYEDMESLMVRASEWSVNQPHVTVVNVYTVTYKRKGFSQGTGYPVFWASVDAEEACLRCVRIAYTKPRTMVTLRVFRPNYFCIRKKTFAPRKSPLSTGNSRARQPGELKYQSFTKTVEEISRWIDSTSAELLCVETIYQHTTDGKFHSSPDSSLVRPSDEKSRDVIALVRVYLKANRGSPLIRSTAASLFNNPADRPFWSRPSAGTVATGEHKKAMRHLIVVLVIGLILVIVGIVVGVVLVRQMGWL